MSAVEVNYSIKELDQEGEICPNGFMYLHSWAASKENADAVVTMICKSFFEKKDWQDWFGDDHSGEVIVEVMSPSAIKGKYIANMTLTPVVDVIKTFTDLEGDDE